MIVWINGELFDENKAQISPSNRGLLFGDGLYDTLLCVGGKAVFANAHAERLAQGCAALGIEAKVDGEMLRTLGRELSNANDFAQATCRMRVTVTRADDANFYSVGTESWIMATMKPVDVDAIDRLRTNGVRTVIAPLHRVPGMGLHNVKATSMAATMWNRRAILQDGADDALIRNSNGEICEALTSNVFAVIDGTLVTPPLDSPCLPGVMRAHVLAWAESLNIATEVSPLPMSYLDGASEGFLTSSINGIVPIVGHEGFPLGNGTPGAITRTLQEQAAQAERSDLSELA